MLSFISRPYWHDTVVCLSVRLSVCDEVHRGYTVHPTVKVSEQVSKKCPPWNTISQILTPYTDLIPSMSPRREPRMLVPSDEYIKTYCEQHNRQNFHLWFQKCHYVRLFLSNSWVTCLWMAQMYRVGQKTAHDFHCNNFVYSQSIFIILAYVHYRKFATGRCIVSPLNTVCVSTLPWKIMITTLSIFTSIVYCSKNVTRLLW